MKHFMIAPSLFCLTLLLVPRAARAQKDDKPLPNLASAPQAKAPAKSSSPQMLQLIHSLAGDWSTEIIYEPSQQFPRGGSGRSRDSYRAGPSHASLIEEYHGDGAGGKTWGTGIIWWDAKAAGFHFVWCDSFALDEGCRVSSQLGNWEGDAYVATDVHEVSGKPVFEKEVWSSITPNSFIQMLYVGDSRDSLKLYMTIKARRVVHAEPAPGLPH